MSSPTAGFTAIISPPLAIKISQAQETLQAGAGWLLRFSQGLVLQRSMSESRLWDEASSSSSSELVQPKPTPFPTPLGTRDPVRRSRAGDPVLADE